MVLLHRGRTRWMQPFLEGACARRVSLLGRLAAAKLRAVPARSPACLPAGRHAVLPAAAVSPSHHQLPAGRCLSALSLAAQLQSYAGQLDHGRQTAGMAGDLPPGHSRPARLWGCVVASSEPWCPVPLNALPASASPLQPYCLLENAPGRMLLGVGMAAPLALLFLSRSFYACEAARVPSLRRPPASPQLLLLCHTP